MKTLDNKYLLYTGILLVGMTAGLCSTSAHANPVTSMLSLLFAETISSDSRSTANEEGNTARWRENLSNAELTALNDIQNHPAVGICMKMADQDHPIASYNARKIAEFSAYVKLSLAKTGQIPAIELIRYQWPARAFRWCSKKAGITTAGKPRNLEQLAYGMIRIVQPIETQQTIIVMRDNNTGK